MNEDHYNRTKDYSFLSNVLKDGVVIGWNWRFNFKSRMQIWCSRLVYNSGYYAESIDHFYYSMYCVAKALLFKKGIAPKTHAGTINMIQIIYTNELFKEFCKERNIKSTADGYGVALTQYDDFQGESIDYLIEEALGDEENGFL